MPEKSLRPDYSYQEQLQNDVYADLLQHERVLLAAAPSAGKTRMAIRIIERGVAEGRWKKVLVLTHGQILLREQWAERFREASELEFDTVAAGESLSNSTHKVVLAIPQSIRNDRASVEIDLLVVDEAHQYYDAPSVQKLIKKFKPASQLLLTGSPAKFVDTDIKIHGITLQELLARRVICDPMIELAKFDYDIRYTDYSNETLSLRKKTVLSARDTATTLDSLLLSLLAKLTSKWRVDPKSFVWASKVNTWDETLARLGKTMLVCHNQSQARFVERYMLSKGVTVSLSISDEDSDSGLQALQTFKEDPACKMFVVVNRGILGFDYAELFNVIDMSATLNVDRIFQLLCRTVRNSGTPDPERKLFLKLTSDRLAPLTYQVMSYVVALSKKEYYYSNLHLKDREIPVPKVYREKLEARFRAGQDSPMRFVDLPNLNTFSSLSSSGAPVESFAYTSFTMVKNLLTGATSWDLASVLSAARKFKCRNDFVQHYAGAYQWLLANKLVDELYQVFPRRATKWTMESALAEARSYPSYADFRVSGAYQWLSKNKLLDAVYVIFPEAQRTGWSLQSALAKAAECPSRNHFKTLYGGAYGFLERNGFMEQLEKVLPSRPSKWTLKAALEAARTCKSRTEFKRRFGGADWYLREHKLEAHLTKVFGPNPQENFKEWDLQKCLEAARKFESREAFRLGAGGAYDYMTRNALHRELDRLFPKTRQVWTREKVISAAQKCRSRTEFMTKHGGAYQWLHRKNELRLLEPLF